MKSNEVSILKILYWEIKGIPSRFQILSWLSRSVPGEFGSRLRRRLLSRYFAAFGNGSVIHPGVKIRNVDKLFVGDNVALGEDVFIQAGGEVELRNNVVLGPGVKIWSQNHDYSGRGPVNNQDYDHKKVLIEDDVWIAANCFIMPGVRIQQGSVVSACSVVGAKPYPPYAVIAGHPARVIGIRSNTEQQEAEGAMENS